jgi:hypothetical protein
LQAAIDVLAAGASAEVALADQSKAPGDAGARRAEIDVDPLWKQFQAPVGAGDLRLVAWTPSEIPGLGIDPPPSQRRGKSVVVAHLEYAGDPPPKNDVNTRASVERRVGAEP